MTEEEMAMVAKDANRHQKIIWDLQAENEALKALNAELARHLESVVFYIETYEYDSEVYQNFESALPVYHAAIAKAKGVQS